MVDTVHPIPLAARKNDASIPAWEISAASIPSFGYITKPGRAVQIDGKIADKNKWQFLQPFDIVLIIKGAVGKVGIIPEEVPPPGPGGWVIGQSAIVLRRKEETPPKRYVHNGEMFEELRTPMIDQRALALLLRSDFGQDFLDQIVSNASIPLIRLAELGPLAIPVPDKDLEKQSIKALEEEARLQREIDHLQQVQSEISTKLWSPKTSL
jgi:type I restriction enzyme M protein